MFLAACGGGGGTGGANQPPDLQTGVDLSGNWVFSHTLTSFAGTLCQPGLSVGQVEVDQVNLAHDSSTRRLVMFPGSAHEVVGTMSGAQVTMTGAFAIFLTEYVLTFSPNGDTCTGTRRIQSTNNGDTCTLLSNVRGSRMGVLVQEPAAASVQICPNSMIAAFFNLPLDPSTVDNETFQVTGPTGTVAGAVNVGGQQAVFFPSAPLAEATVYTARLSTAVRASNGTPLPQDVIWSFTTLDYEGAVLASDPIAYWRFHETSGNAAQSLVGGSAATATFAGTFVRNQPGPWVHATATSFATSADDGRMESTRAFAAATVDGRTVLAVEFWLHPEEDRANQGYCSAPGIFFGGRTTTPDFILNQNRFVGSVETRMGEWTHIVLQLTGSQAEVWRNGQLALQQPFNDALIPFSPDTVFQVGRGSRSTMDEVAIYHHALSATEIQSHYAAGTHCQ